jgi:hypothetical protein
VTRRRLGDQSRAAGTDRGVSTALGFVLSLTVTTILISGLLIAGGSLVDGERNQTVRNELRVIGQQMAADLTAADRLARLSDEGTLQIARGFPETVTGARYTVTVSSVGGDAYQLALATRQPDVSVTVGFVSATPVDTGTGFTGGDVVITYDHSVGTLEVQND